MPFHGFLNLPVLLEDIALAVFLLEFLKAILWNHQYAILWQYFFKLLYFVALIEVEAEEVQVLDRYVRV